jgi:hypothetical protein
MVVGTCVTAASLLHYRLETGKTGIKEGNKEKIPTRM